MNLRWLPIFIVFSRLNGMDGDELKSILKSTVRGYKEWVRNNISEVGICTYISDTSLSHYPIFSYLKNDVKGHRFTNNRRFIIDGINNS